MTENPSHIDRYQVIDAIGRGGMGTVYLARDPAIGRLLAIKLLKEEFDEDQRKRFEREARSVGQLDHGNIVTVYDVGDHNGRPFIAMSYIPGETLTELIKRRAPLPLVRKLRIVEELCAGLHAAHKAGIVHRDIKPANVMVDPDGVVKILDFGIARLASEATQKTQEGTIIGSYNYMSPEQIVGKALNHRSDIFAVGAILYEVLSYTRAFAGTLRDGLWYRLVHEPPPPLRELFDDLDTDVERIVMRALEKDPAMRYQEIEHMRRDIARARRRLLAAELDASVKEAAQAMRDRAYQAALASAQAALALEPDDARALELADHANKAIDEQRMGECLAQARAEIARGALAEATKSIEDALAIDGVSPDARSLGEEVERLVTERAEHENSARGTVAAAERRFESGDHEGALAELEAFAPPHPVVTDKMHELQARANKRRDALLRIAVARQSVTDGDFVAALAASRELDALDPSLPGLAALKAEAKAGEYGLQSEDIARRESRQRLDEVRTLHDRGNHREALKALDRAIARDPVREADRRHEFNLLRDRIEDAFTQQILEAERTREVSELLSRAKATAVHDAALPILRKLLEIDPNHIEAKALLAERTAGRDETRGEHDRQNRLAEVRIRIDAHLAKNELAQAERALLQAELDFQDQGVFAAIRRRIEELRRLGAPSAHVAKPTAADPAVDPDIAPTMVVERTRLQRPVKSRAPATTKKMLVVTALVITVVTLFFITNAC